MSSLLTGVAIAALFSLTSLLVVLLRVSPLTAPGKALTALFLSLFLSISTLSTLASFGLWKTFAPHKWDAGTMLSIALREGLFLGLATVIFVLFFLFGVLTWWVGLCTYLIFVFVEMALLS